MTILVIPNFYYINILHLVIFGILLCSIGVYGFLSTQGNTILFLISNEIFLLGIIFGFVSVGEIYGDMTGQLFAVVILVVAAVETAIVLILFLVFYRYTDTWELDLIGTIQSKPTKNLNVKSNSKPIH